MQGCCRSQTTELDPADVFASVAHLPGSVLLESQSAADGRQYSILCSRPFGTIVTKGRHTRVTINGKTVETDSSPFDVLSNLLSRYRITHSPDVVFPGGVVGYFGYELRTFIEDSPVRAPDGVPAPDCWLGLYDSALVFDHVSGTVSLNTLDTAAVDAHAAFALLDGGASAPAPAPSDATICDLESDFTKDKYCAAVRRAKEYIAAGDIYQVNLSQRFTARLSAHPWDVYMRLKKRNPAAYAAYLNTGESQVISISPELFLLHDPATRMVETKPIKGTRPRSPDEVEDRRLAMELAESEKDRAENVMIVDLERNDLGRVCDFGSVEVPNLMDVESYPTVHHLVTRVTGRLRDDCSAVDLLTSCFPGGSITGAPKIRAMEIIDELEPVKRGVYTGSIGYLGFDGSVNLNIAIRTAVVSDGVCSLHVGGGIVADSDPEAEYQETLDKGRAFFEVLGCQRI